jgi:hypothetical protein
MVKTPRHCWIIWLAECFVVAAAVWLLGVRIARWGDGHETLAVLAAAAAAGGILGNYLDRLLCRSIAMVQRLFSSKKVDEESTVPPLKVQLEVLVVVLLTLPDAAPPISLEMTEANVVRKTHARVRQD